GKSAILLSLLTSQNEILGVCDVFDQQQLNADRSGEGNRAIFDANMKTYGNDVKLRVFAKRSAQLTTEDTTTTCRLFHIDGGHRPQDVYADMQVAERALLPKGVVFIDDVFNPNWPGVSEGVYQFFSDQSDVFAPICIGGNKVAFARAENANC